MWTIKNIRGKDVEVQILDTRPARFSRYEIVQYFYKPKEPVYYAFYEGEKYDPFLIASSYMYAVALADQILLHRKERPEKTKIRSTKVARKKLNFTTMRNLKILK